MNLTEWLGSKKVKGMLATQGALVLLALGVTYMADGDPEKIKAILAALQDVVLGITGVGMVAVGAQGVVDAKAASGKTRKK